MGVVVAGCPPFDHRAFSMPGSGAVDKAWTTRQDRHHDQGVERQKKFLKYSIKTMIKRKHTSNIYSIRNPLHQGLQACPSRPKKSSSMSNSRPIQPPRASSPKGTPTASISSPTIPPSCAAPSPTWRPASTSPTGASSSSSPPWSAPEVLARGRLLQSRQLARPPLRPGALRGAGAHPRRPGA